MSLLFRKGTFIGIKTLKNYLERQGKNLVVGNRVVGCSHFTRFFFLLNRYKRIFRICHYFLKNMVLQQSFPGNTDCNFSFPGIYISFSKKNLSNTRTCSCRGSGGCGSRRGCLRGCGRGSRRGCFRGCGRGSRRGCFRGCGRGSRRGCFRGCGRGSRRGCLRGCGRGSRRGCLRGCAGCCCSGRSHREENTAGHSIVAGNLDLQLFTGQARC